MVTIAPELPGAINLIRELSRTGVVVSLGHSEATSEIASAAAAGGASMVTHLFNAMTGFHHRRDGLVVWALGRSDVSLGVIADGVHVAGAALSLVERCAGERVILVSDATAASLAPSGTYQQAGTPVVRHPDGRVTTFDDRLAGSGSVLAEIVPVWASETAGGFAGAIRSATYRPAAKVGIRCGLAAGYPANVVLWSEQCRVTTVIFRGTRVN